MVYYKLLYMLESRIIIIFFNNYTVYEFVQILAKLLSCRWSEFRRWHSNGGKIYKRINKS